MKAKVLFLFFSILISQVDRAQPAYPYKPAASCANEDFELGSATATISSMNQVSGWTLSKGTYTGSNNICDLASCCPNNPSESALIFAPNGYTDAVIGSCYPIYSVFGSGQANSAAQTQNLQLWEPMYGNSFIRINSGAANSSVERLSKTVSVTPQNNLFQYAYIAVFSRGHDCCDAAGFKVRLLDAGTQTPIPCPGYSATAGTTCPMPDYLYYIPGPCYTATNTSGSVFNKWKIVSMDLTPYIGQTLIIEVVASDCNQSDHYGYAYFDAQCGPMTISANGNSFDANVPVINISSCGQTTICAKSGLGPYSWAGPNLSPDKGVPSYSNICLTTSVSATYTLFINPEGSCVPIMRQLNLSITPALQLSAPPVFNLCGMPQIQISPIKAGPAGGYTYTWSVPPNAVVSGLNTSILTTNAPGVYTVMTSNPSNSCTSSAQLTVEVCVGVRESELLEDARIFPNPNKGIFTIYAGRSLKSISVEVYDLFGKLVLRREISAVDKEIDIRNSLPGVYIVRLEEKDGSHFIKIVKE